MIENTILQLTQILLTPILVILGLAFAYAVWVAGMLLVEFWQRGRNPAFAYLTDDPALSLEELEMQVLRQLEPLRLLSRVTPLLGLIATMIPLGSALQGVAAGNGQETLGVFSGAFGGVVLALAASAIGLVAYSLRRRWLLPELVAIRKRRGVHA